MPTNFDEYLDILGGDDFEEKPVDVHTFIRSRDFLGLPPVSDHQLNMISAMTQIFRKETLIDLYGEEAGLKRWAETFNEVIFQLGKGSGKDYASSIACAYVVYQLLCLKDPAGYYGKPPGDNIDIINIAINAQQAKNVFFNNFTSRIKHSPWFVNKYSMTADACRFDKEITVHSGHSQRESWEGYNVIMVVLDEISGFAIDNLTGHTQAKTGEEIYKMYRASVTSRFPDFGKLALLSFPRFKGDFIQKRYDQVIASKETIIREAELVVNEEMPADTPGNKIKISWEEDHIVAYREARVYALKRPSWDVNPLRVIEDYVRDFFGDPVDSLSRFACMPPDAIDGFFRDRVKVEEAFSIEAIAVDEEGQFADWFKPRRGKQYYIHVDLAQKVDRCAVSMAHVEKWVNVKIGKIEEKLQPVVVIDALRYWTPKSNKTVDFEEVREYIIYLAQLGFDIRMVTFDRWNSHDMMQQLKTYGLNSENLSVAKKHYTDMAGLLPEGRLLGPRNEILINELLQLQVKGDKIDHPRSGSKDLADAVCGSVFNAISLTPKETNPVVEVYTYVYEPEEKKAPEPKPKKAKSPPPKELADYLDYMSVI